MLTLVGLGLVLTACVPEEPSLARRYEPDTYMRELQDEGLIRIAVPDAVPPIGYEDGGEPRGLAVELGRIIADTLGVRAEVTAVDSDRLEGLVDVGGADVAFPFTPLTEELARERVATDPYLVGHQRLLVPRDAGIGGVVDLDSASVCAFVDPVTGVDLEDLAPTSVVRAAPSIGACTRLLARGEVDAITAQDFLLGEARAELQATGALATELVGDDLNTVGYGAITLPQPAFGQFVRDVLEEAQSDGRWRDAYRRWVKLPLIDPPTMTLQDAASLWPSGAKP